MADGRSPYQDFVSFYTAFFEDVKWGSRDTSKQAQKNCYILRHQHTSDLKRTDHPD